MESDQDNNLYMISLRVPVTYLLDDVWMLWGEVTCSSLLVERFSEYLRLIYGKCPNSLLLSVSLIMTISLSDLFRNEMTLYFYIQSKVCDFVSKTKSQSRDAKKFGE